jgi:hypothetical protein
MAKVRSSKQSTWTRAAGVSDALRRDVTRRGDELLERTFKRGQSFYLCVRYRPPEPADEFVVRSTRLEYAGRNRFHLAYFRHKDRWQPVYHGLTVECFDTIEQKEIFWPLT